MRWLLRPTSDTFAPIPSANVTDFNQISSNLGAAVGYAMTYAYQNTVSPYPHPHHGMQHSDALGFSPALALYPFCRISWLPLKCLHYLLGSAI